MKDGRAAVARIFQQCFVISCLRPGADLAAHQGLHRRRVRDRARRAHAGDRRAAIDFLAQVIRAHRRRLHRIARTDRYPSAGGRPQLTNRQRKSGEAMHCAACHVGRQSGHMKLNVRRHRLGRQRAHEASALIDPDRQRPTPCEQPLQSDLHTPCDRTQFIVGRNRSRAFVHQPNLQMVLQILAHARQIVYDTDAVLREQRGRTNPG